jgi:hypothetical protein
MDSMDHVPRVSPTPLELRVGLLLRKLEGFQEFTLGFPKQQ